MEFDFLTDKLSMPTDREFDFRTILKDGHYTIRINSEWSTAYKEGINCDYFEFYLSNKYIS